MTEKKEKILEVALKLFAENGYTATPTSKVAKEANVSEGLIFRHYTSKEGLLNAIMEQGREMANSMFTKILELQDAKSILKGIIELPFDINEEQFHYWKLIYALKWQTDSYNENISEPIKDVLFYVFKDLGYANPKAEAELVLLLIDGIATTILLQKPENTEELKKAILEKYKL